MLPKKRKSLEDYATIEKFVRDIAIEASVASNNRLKTSYQTKRTRQQTPLLGTQRSQSQPPKEKKRTMKDLVDEIMNRIRPKVEKKKKRKKRKSPKRTKNQEIQYNKEKTKIDAKWENYNQQIKRGNWQSSQNIKPNKYIDILPPLKIEKKSNSFVSDSIVELSQRDSETRFQQFSNSVLDSSISQSFNAEDKESQLKEITDQL